jgi:hypothetical protein
MLLSRTRTCTVSPCCPMQRLHAQSAKRRTLMLTTAPTTRAGSHASLPRPASAPAQRQSPARRKTSLVPARWPVPSITSMTLHPFGMHATLLFSNGLSENRGGPRVQRQTALDSPAAASWLPLDGRLGASQIFRRPHHRGPVVITSAGFPAQEPRRSICLRSRSKSPSVYWLV